MKPIAAIVEPADTDVARAARAVDKAMQRLREAEQHERAADERAQSARQATARARLELGRELIAARKNWPMHGPGAKGWTDFLAVRRIAVDFAKDAMKYAGFVEKKYPGASENAPRDLKLPTMREAGLDNRPRDEDEESDEDDIDRDTWCTPSWLTDPIGHFDLDPCSNERSNVDAEMSYHLEHGQDGLALAPDVPANTHVFINPPYSDVPPWVAAYKHTRFCFLLKLDTSTKWFAELYAATALILIPRRRVNFEPPPGVPPEKAVAQQFPHALFYAHAEDATPAIRGLCWAWRVDTTNT